VSIFFDLTGKRTAKCPGIFCRYLLALSLFPALASFPASSPPQEPQQTSEFATLAKQIVAKLEPDGKLNLVVFDFRKPVPNSLPNLDLLPSPTHIMGLTGESSDFGAWLADQISSALAEAGQPVVGRNVLFAALRDRNVSPRDWLSYNSATIVAKSVGADAILVGTISAINDHIGLTLKVYSFTSGHDLKHPTPDETITGELTVTHDLAAHLGAPLDSFGPSDGVYTPGEGGIEYPKCVHCPNPTYSGEASARRIQGDVSLSTVITPEGHATQVKLIKSAGYGLDEQAINALKQWRFKAGTDLRGNPVPVLAPVEITFRMY
jgi:TonB family protein